MVRPSSHDLKPYQRALERTGDVTVGAYARRLLLKRIALGLVGVALIVGAVGLYHLLDHDRPAAATGAQQVLRCRSCGAEQVVAPDPQRSFPATCGQCAERAVWPLWECRSCGKRFVPVESDAFAVRCPKCGGTEVGTAAPVATEGDR
jgi:predicted RNA-binding Zn-ribbon protein involved in translation (DUF1610 family)